MSESFQCPQGYCHKDPTHVLYHLLGVYDHYISAKMKRNTHQIEIWKMIKQVKVLHKNYILALTSNSAPLWLCCPSLLVQGSTSWSVLSVFKSIDFSFCLQLCMWFHHAKQNTTFKNMNQLMQAIKFYSKEHFKHE